MLKNQFSGDTYLDSNAMTFLTFLINTFFKAHIRISFGFLLSKDNLCFFSLKNGKVLSLTSLGISKLSG